MNSKINKNKNLRNLAYQNLKSQVLSGVLPPNQPIVERLVSQKIGISRTPIREALGRLEQEGLVRVIPRCGTFPVTLSQDKSSDVHGGETAGLKLRTRICG